ncbi:hypothetical protein GOP47_0015070 [Adiantum capillus-veneris]|uniref:BED-type domain-containing protein n=1 Tax=Adiantum capillus-veneris TaxID=13818 RepID=A0A9D4UN72_ADICA|nr:hypothetical protein GOP47_0015070 [Adiantum capillus-veneris]
MVKNVGTSGTKKPKNKKAPGKEWDYAHNKRGQYMEWQCKFCHTTKSGGAPRIRDHFLCTAKNNCKKCEHSKAPAVAKRLREELAKKSGKRQQIYSYVPSSQEFPEPNINSADPIVTPTNLGEQPAQGEEIQGSVPFKRHNEGGLCHQSFRV